MSHIDRLDANECKRGYQKLLKQLFKQRGSRPRPWPANESLAARISKTVSRVSARIGPRQLPIDSQQLLPRVWNKNIISTPPPVLKHRLDGGFARWKAARPTNEGTNEAPPEPARVTIDIRSAVVWRPAKSLHMHNPPLLSKSGLPRASSRASLSPGFSTVFVPSGRSRPARWLLDRDPP